MDLRPAVHAGPAWHTLLDGDARALVERDHLLPYLHRQRWFSGKARRATSARFVDWGTLSAGEEPSFLALVDVAYADGGIDRFFLPMGTRSGQAALALEHEMPTAVLARIAGVREGVLHDRVEDLLATALLEAIETAREIALRHGVVQAAPTSAFEAVSGPARVPALRPRRLAGEQSNTSVLYDDRFILKLIRRLEPGLNPDYEIGYHLTERVGFRRVPRLAGGLDYRGADGTRTILGILQGLVDHQANGWDHGVDQARRSYDRALAHAGPPPDPVTDAASLVALSRGPLPPIVCEVVGGYLDTARVLGRRTAELHLALARAVGDPAFEPEPVETGQLARLAHEMTAHAGQALDALEAALGRVPERLSGRARQLVDGRAALIERFDELARLEAAVTRIRVHGDYHLGQVLYDRGDFVILDFEGEPLRPLEERRRKHPAVKDVAGMLRSFSYAAYAGLFASTADRREDFERLEPWAKLWYTWVSSSFLRAYCAAAEGASFLPADASTLDVLLRAFLLDKALYELLYELNNRPDWLRIPLWGILGLVSSSRP